LRLNSKNPSTSSGRAVKAKAVRAEGSRSMNGER
jgi:hypothetical protein